MIVYDNDNDLLEKVNYSGWQNERSQIAGRPTVLLRDHTYTRRAEQLLSYTQCSNYRCTR